MVIMLPMLLLMNFSSTKMVANKYQQNVSELERAYKPKTDAEKSLYVSKLDTPAEEGYKAADPEQFQQWTKRKQNTLLNMEKLVKNVLF